MFASPFISDIHSFQNLDIKFELSQPFLPFQQLLSVLPSASKSLLPSAYHDLMTNKNSAIAHYYPSDFETDLNGKKQEWEAVVLIPFIDEKSLLNEMNAKDNLLTKAEKERNIHGPMLKYYYSAASQGTCEGMSKNNFNFLVFTLLFFNFIKMYSRSCQFSKYR